MAKKSPIKPKGKGKQALSKLNSINNNIASITKELENASKILTRIIKRTEEFGSFDMQSEIYGQNQNKKRCMFENVPDRIEFKLNNFNFYIDFTLVSKDDEPTDLNGSIIYGTNRTTCFTDCTFIIKNEKCKNCERIARCDRFEDKALMHFLVDRNGRIKSSGDLEDEWWIKEKEDMLDLHLRTLALIWVKALEWTNANILP